MELFDLEKGKMVEVTKGRKVAIGTKGVIVWFETQRYTMWCYSDRYSYTKVGIKLDNGSVVYTYVDNIEYC